MNYYEKIDFFNKVWYNEICNYVCSFIERRDKSMGDYFRIIDGPSRDELKNSYYTGDSVQFEIGDEAGEIFTIEGVVEDFQDGSGHDFVFDFSIVDIEESASSEDLMNRYISGVKYSARSHKGEFEI